MSEEAERAAAMNSVRQIWALSGEIERSGYRDLAPRAAEIHAMAHYMLYDVDGGLEEETS